VDKTAVANVATRERVDFMVEVMSNALAFVPEAAENLRATLIRKLYMTFTGRRGRFPVDLVVDVVSIRSDLSLRTRRQITRTMQTTEWD
jgi:hypothetical protein